MMKPDLRYVYVNSNIDDVKNFNNAVLKRDDCIIHNTIVCQSKLYRLCRLIEESGKGNMSPSELARKIMRNEID